MIKIYSRKFVAVWYKICQDTSVFKDLSIFFTKLQKNVKNIKFAKEIIMRQNIETGGG